jgi:Zn-dependent alcohol dehydrogenase
VLPAVYRAAVCDERGNVRVAELLSRPPEPDEVAVRIVASGICHTDLRSLRWGRPIVLGHEGVGIVVESGDDSDVAAGSTVILNWAQPCGSCEPCGRGDVALCTGRDLGDPAVSVRSVEGVGYSRSFRLGTLAEYTVVRASAVTPIVVEPHEDVASLCAVGCAGLTAYGAVTRVARVAAGECVVVIGVGSVGQHVVQSAVAMGAARVVAVDRRIDQLDRAIALGATDVVIAGDDVAAVAAQVTGMLGRGADVAFECSGVASLSPEPLRFIRNAGLAVNLSGSTETVAFDMNLFQWDKRYVNPLYGACRPNEDVPTIMEMRAQGRWNVECGLGRRWPLVDVEHALRAAADGGDGKAVVIP